MEYDKDNEYASMSMEERTSRTIGEIANTIDSNIQVTIDRPGNNRNGKVPILDIEVWVDRDSNRIGHSFYRKPIASKYVIMQRSAMPQSTKRNTLFQEGLKRVTYTRGGAQVYSVEDNNDDLEWDKVELRLSDVAIDKLEEFNNMMRLSGYDEFYRMRILRGVHDRVKTIELEILKGTRERYRNRTQIKMGHLASMGRYNNTWFLKGGGGYTSVINVQPTPKGQLAKGVREAIGDIRAPDGGKTKVVEVGGDHLSMGLFKADPYKTKGCPFDRTCSIAKKQVCTQQKVVYQLKCLVCMDENGQGGKVAVYRGQSGCSGHKRCLEHMDAIRRGDGSSGMGAHIREAHPNINPAMPNIIEMSIVEQRHKNMERGIAEAIHIEQIEKDEKVISTNRKAEWGRAPLRRLAIFNNLQ